MRLTDTIGTHKSVLCFFAPYLPPGNDDNGQVAARVVLGHSDVAFITAWVDHSDAWVFVLGDLDVSGTHTASCAAVHGIVCHNSQSWAAVALLRHPAPSADWLPTAEVLLYLPLNP